MVDLLTFIDGGTLGDLTLPPLRLPGRDPIRLSDLQRGILREAKATNADGLPRYRTVALAWPKGGGKSLIAAAELARIFVTVPDSRSIILGPSERQVASVVAHTFRDRLRGTYPGFDVGKTVIENPSLGSSVVVVPASEASVQGVRPHRGRVVIDEAHEFPADPQARADSEVGGALNLLLSQAEEAASQVWLLGMLGTADGYLYHLKGLAEAGAVPHVYLSFETSPLALNPTMTEKFLAQRKAEMLPAIYAAHFENAVTGGAGMVFDPQWLEAAKDRGKALGLENPLTPEQWQAVEYRHRFYTCRALGIDRAMSLTAKHDKTVLSLLARPYSYSRTGGLKPVYLVALKTMPVGHTADDILAVVSEWHRNYGSLRQIVMDQYQCLDLARACKHHGRVELVHETSGWQLSAFQVLGRYLADNRLVLPVGDGTDYLVGELSRIRMEVNRALTGARFEGKPHDDSAHATALAAFGLSMLPESHDGPVDQEPVERPTKFYAARCIPTPDGGFIVAPGGPDSPYRGDPEQDR